MSKETEVEVIRQKYLALSPVMDERTRRHWAATEALSLGWGGLSLVSAATGLSRNTIALGVRELQHRIANPGEPVVNRVRRVGGGRKRLVERDASIWRDLNSLIDPTGLTGFGSPLKWTCKTTRELAEELRRQNHVISDRAVAKLLKGSGFRQQVRSRTPNGSPCKDPDHQFRHINWKARSFRRNGIPIVFVEIKKPQFDCVLRDDMVRWQPIGKGMPSQTTKSAGRFSSSPAGQGSPKDGSARVFPATQRNTPWPPSIVGAEIWK
jgi:hypothetical protein